MCRAIILCNIVIEMQIYIHFSVLSTYVSFPVIYPHVSACLSFNSDRAENDGFFLSLLTLALLFPKGIPDILRVLIAFGTPKGNPSLSKLPVGWPRPITGWGQCWPLYSKPNFFNNFLNSE